MDSNRLREVLDYDPDTGIFTWKVRVSAYLTAKGEMHPFFAEGGERP